MFFHLRKWTRWMQPFQLLVSFVLHSSASDELRLLCQSSPGKDVFFLQFSPLVAAVIVIRCIIPKGIAGPLSVVKLHIALDHVDEFFRLLHSLSLKSMSSSVSCPPAQDLFGKHIEVESHFKVEVPDSGICPSLYAFWIVSYASSPT